MLRLLLKASKVRRELTFWDLVSRMMLNSPAIACILECFSGDSTVPEQDTGVILQMLRFQHYTLRRND